MGEDEKTIIFIPREGNYIEILGHKIDGYNSFLIWATITLEGKIKTEKVWREALKEYAEKRTKHKLEEKDLKFESEDK